MVIIDLDVYGQADVKMLTFQKSKNVLQTHCFLCQPHLFHPRPKVVWHTRFMRQIKKNIIFELMATQFKMNRIKEVLEERELFQIWLSKQLSKSYNVVNFYAQNRRQSSIEILYKISDILDIEAKDLLKEKRMIKK